MSAQSQTSNTTTPPARSDDEGLREQIRATIFGFPNPAGVEIELYPEDEDLMDEIMQLIAHHDEQMLERALEVLPSVPPQSERWRYNNEEEGRIQGVLDCIAALTALYEGEGK